jgi:hypothetical protein
MGSEKNQFIDIVTDASFSEYRLDQKSGRYTSYRKTIGTSSRIDKVRRLSATATFHVFDYDRRFSRNVPLECVNK